jgi:hypothetical protein
LRRSGLLKRERLVCLNYQYTLRGSVSCSSIVLFIVDSDAVSMSLIEITYDSKLEMMLMGSKF